MSSNGKCYIEIANQANYTFSNVRDNDLVISMTGTEAGLHAGYTSASSNALLSVTKEYFLLGGNNSNFSVSNNVVHIKDINITGSLNKNGIPFSLSNVSGHIIPVSNLTYDLGSSNMRFRDLYISGNTIDMEGTKITLDMSNNIQIKDSNNNLSRIIVDEIQIGDDTGSAVRIKKDIDGNVQFYKASNSIETLTDVGTGGGGISLSNVNQSISSPVPSTGYTQNVINIPTVTIEYVPASAKISYGRVEFGSHSNFSMSNGASITVNIDHSLNTTEYIIFSTSENSLDTQVSCFDYTSNSFSMTVKNISGSNIANPVVNYQLIQAQTSNVTRVLAAPPTVIVTSCNLATYSGAASSNKQVGLSNFTLASDPANYPITYAIASNVTNLFNLSNNVIIYNHQKVTANNNPFLLLAANPYASNTASPITFNMEETFVNQPLASVNTISTTQNAVSVGEAGASNLPSTDQGLPVTYTLGTNTLGAILTGNTLSWTAAGATQTRSVILNASFAAAIMAEAALAVKEITFSVSETFNNSLGTVQWIARISGTADDSGASISNTSDGGIVVAGYYTSSTITAYNANTTTFATTLGNAGLYETFLVKYSNFGTVQWVARISGTNQDYGLLVSGLSDGGIIVMGDYLSSPLTAYNSSNTAFATTLTNSGGSDVFVIKYGLLGNVQWVTRVAGTGNSPARGLGGTSDGFIISGAYNASSLVAYNANNTAFGTTLPVPSGDDAFVAKYNFAGSVQWIARLTGSVGDVPYTSCTTSDGGAVVSGYYDSNPLTAFNANATAFGTTLPNSGGSDVFLVKYDSTGVVQWVARLAGSGSEGGNGICGTTDGGVVVTGNHNSSVLTAYNANGTAFGTTIGTANTWGGFTAKYSSSGTVQWIAKIDGGTQTIPQEVCSTSDGGAVITGYYLTSTLTVYNANGTTYGTLPNTGSWDAFVVKYNSTGSVLWITRIIGDNGNDYGFGISATNDGGIVVTGYYSSNPLTVFDSSGNTFGQQLLNSGTNDVFIVKYSDVAQSLTAPIIRNKWVAQIGGSVTEAARGVAASADGDVYVVGEYNSTTTVYNANGTSFGTTLANSGTDAFITKYNSSGVTQWVAKVSGSGNEVARGVCVTSDGGIVVGGLYTSATLTVYNSNTTAFGTTLANAGSEDMFVVKYDSLGNVQWVTRLNGSGVDESWNICSTNDGGVVAVGMYQSNPFTAYNSNGTAFGSTLSNSGLNDLFVVKYNSSGNVEWVAKLSGSNNDVFPIVCSTSDNGLAITGYYISNPLTAYNANGSAFATTLISSSYDVFVVKYNSSGTVQWIARLSGSSPETGNFVCGTSDGGIVVTGYFDSNPLTAYNADTSAFGTSLANSGGSDVGLVKYNSSGVVQWVARIGGTGTDVGNRVCSTSDGGIIVAGHFSSSPLTAYNANTSAFETTLLNVGSNDIFMIRYDNNGFVQAVAGFGGTGDDQTLGIAAHPDGDVIISGHFNNRITLHSSIRTLTSIGGQDAFVAKYGVKSLLYPTASGRCEWVARIAATGADSGAGICTTNDGGIVVIGTYVANPVTAYNANGTSFGTTLASSGSNDTFIAKYDSSGSIQWVARIGGATGENGIGICNTSDGGVAVTGFYTSTTLTAYNADATAFGTTIAFAGNMDVFVAKYTLSGIVEWVARLAGNNQNLGVSICNTTDGGLVITGWFYSSVLTAYNANTTAFATTLSNSGSSDVFVVKYNSSGSVQWVSKLGGAGTDEGRGLCSTRDGGVIVTGNYGSSPLTAFNANNTSFATTLANAGSNDVFVAKYNSSGNVEWLARLAGTGSDIGFFATSTNDGGIAVVGYYTSSPLTAYHASTAAFGTTLANSSGGTDDAFLVKYNASGTVQWVARMAGTSADNARAVSSTSDGGIVVIGYYQSNPFTAYNANTTAFGTTLANAGSHDIFVVKYSSEGVVQLITRLSSAGSDQGLAVSVSPERSIYVTGNYQGTLTAYNANTTAFSTTLAPVNVEDVFVAKYIM